MQRTRSGVMVLGDLHWDWPSLAKLMSRHRPELVLLVGDLDYLPGSRAWKHFLKAYHVPKGCTIRFVEGNHDDLDSLWAMRQPGPPRAYEIRPGMFWQDRGSTLTLLDGRVVLFLGGALSIDRPRKPGIDWWPDKEVLGPEVLNVLPERADIVISHTAPAAFPIPFGRTEAQLRKIGWRPAPDPTREVLDQVLAKLKPSRWFFGHFHRRLEGETTGCRWTGLAHLEQPSLEEGTCWCWLENGH